MYIQTFTIKFLKIKLCFSQSLYLTGASVPAAKGLNPWGDVLLAYEMNGQVNYSKKSYNFIKKHHIAQRHCNGLGSISAGSQVLFLVM